MNTWKLIPILLLTCLFLSACDKWVPLKCRLIESDFQCTGLSASEFKCDIAIFNSARAVVSVYTDTVLSKSLEFLEDRTVFLDGSGTQIRSFNTSLEQVLTYRHVSDKEIQIELLDPDFFENILQKCPKFNLVLYFEYDREIIMLNYELTNM